MLPITIAQQLSITYDFSFIVILAKSFSSAQQVHFDRFCSTSLRYFPCFLLPYPTSYYSRSKLWIGSDILALFLNFFSAIIFFFDVKRIQVFFLWDYYLDTPDTICQRVEPHDWFRPKCHLIYLLWGKQVNSLANCYDVSIEWAVASP